MAVGSSLFRQFHPPMKKHAVLSGVLCSMALGASFTDVASVNLEQALP
jgi:hypothetical protein